LCAASVLIVASSVAAADTLDDIKARGKVIVAIDPTFAPYEFTDASGNVQGLSPAIMDAVAKKLGVQIEYQKTAFSGIIPGLLAKSFDLEASSLNVTAERAKRVLYTVPYGRTVNGVLVRNDSTLKSPTAVEALAGLTGAVKAGTIPEKLLREFNTALETKGAKPIRILTVDSVDQTVSALLGKRADFVFDDITVLGAAMKQNPGALRNAGTLGPSQWIAWATRPDDKRLNQLISDQILAMQASGQLGALQEQFLGVKVTVPDKDFVPKE
jgi:polar amino acid transport system substrate-binding protein